MTPLSFKCVSSRLLFIIGITLVAPPHIIFSSGPSDNFFVSSSFLIIGNALSEHDLLACERCVDEADTSPPHGKLDYEEYTKFISLWSEGLIDKEDFDYLPRELITEFHLNSDLDDEGDQLYIPTAHAKANDEASLTQICAVIRHTMHEILPPETF